MKTEKRYEEGGAVVEVAILSLVMVPMILYAIFFFDMALVNVKVLEATRYAAWEMTAMSISDYKNHRHLEDGYLNERLKNLRDEVALRWNDDMNSATSPDSYLNGFDGIYDEKISGLSVTEIDSENISVSSEDESAYVYSKEQSLPGSGNISNSEDAGLLQGAIDKIQSLVGQGASWVYAQLGFNVNGFVRVGMTVPLRFKKSAPIYKGEGLFVGGVPDVHAYQKLLVDAWDLKNGQDADYGQAGASSEDGGAGEEYYNQLKKMVFLGIPGIMDELMGGVGDVVSTVLNALGVRNPLLPVIRSYAMKGAVSENECSRNKSACFTFKDGQYAKVSGLGGGIGAPKTFYTNVFKDSYERSSSSYWKVYRNQTGQDGGSGYYMGCDKPQVVDRQDCWKN